MGRPVQDLVHGDTSGWFKPPVDKKSSVLAWLISQGRPGQNGTFVLMSTGGLNQPDVSSCMYMYLGWEEVIVDVIGEAGHLLQPGAGAVLEHLVLKIDCN